MVTKLCSGKQFRISQIYVEIIESVFSLIFYFIKLISTDCSCWLSNKCNLVEALVRNNEDILLSPTLSFEVCKKDNFSMKKNLQQTQNNFSEVHRKNNIINKSRLLRIGLCEASSNEWPSFSINDTKITLGRLQKIGKSTK